MHFSEGGFPFSWRPELGNILRDRKGLKGKARRSAKRGDSAEVALTFEQSVVLMISYTRFKIKGVTPMSRKSDRREFLKTGLITTAAVIASGPAAMISPRYSFAQGSPDLVISHGRNPATMTRAAVDALGGMKRFVKPGNKVVIKPNMSFASGPQAASNTHPAVVGEVARMCSEAGASRISILDNPLQQPQDCLAMSKIPEMCEVVPNTRVYMIKPQRLFREVKLDRGILVKSMEVSSEVLDSDVLISVPVGKTHGSAGVSLSMKGMMGLIFDTDRRAFHSRDLHESIVDMVTILKPHLVCYRRHSDSGQRWSGRSGRSDSAQCSHSLA